MVATAAWGLDSEGDFRSDALHSDAESVPVAAQLCRMLRTKESSDVAAKALDDLKRVHRRLVAEEANEGLSLRSDREKGRILLYLFQRDLLPGASGAILDSKSNRDDTATKAVYWQTKLAGWIFILALNLGMLAFVLLFAVNETLHRQGAWARSFCIWLAADIVLVSSVTVVFTHVYIPSLIMDDVHRIKRRLAECIRSFNARLGETSKDGSSVVAPGQTFNAASYLFVSSRLALLWPTLKESQIILSFHTPWMHSYDKETNVGGKYTSRYSALSRSASMVAVFLVSSLMRLPHRLQDTLLRQAATVAAAVVALAHVLVYKVSPALIAVPVVVVVGVIAGGVYWCLHSRPTPDSIAAVDEEAGNAGVDLYPGEPAGGAGAMASPRGHLNRQESRNQGMDVLRALRVANAGGGGAGMDAVRAFSSLQLIDPATGQPVPPANIAKRKPVVTMPAHRESPSGSPHSGQGSSGRSQRSQRLNNWFEVAQSTLGQSGKSARTPSSRAGLGGISARSTSGSPGATAGDRLSPSGRNGEQDVAQYGW